MMWPKIITPQLTTLLFITIHFLIHADPPAAEQLSSHIPQINSEVTFNLKNALAEKDKITKERKKRVYFPPSPVVTDQEKALYAKAFSRAPALLKTLITGIKQNSPHTQSYKHLLLCGPAGAGKSTLAQAIAHALNRKCVTIHAPSLLGHYRDQAAENVRELFKEYDESSEKLVIVIEEMNALTDDHTSEHADTKHTAMQLWTLLDAHQKDKDFLLIGTTNITKKMPHQLQSRFKGQTFFIDNPSYESRFDGLNFWLKYYDLKQAPGAKLDGNFWSPFVQKMENFSHRDMETLVKTALLFAIAEQNNPQTKLISHTHFEQAYDHLKKENEKLWDFTEQVTSEERRHKESLEQSKKQFEENQDMQIRLVEWNMLFQSFTNSMCNARWQGNVENLNSAKEFAFPNKKPLTKIHKHVVEKGFWTDKIEERVTFNN